MVRYVEANQCRMSSLVRHFGDEVDGRWPCGVCDFCAPDKCVAGRSRPANGDEERIVLDVIKSLKKSYAKSTGKLHKEMFPHEETSRDEFENLLGAMAVAGMVTIENASFENDGKNIAYRKVGLTQYGEELEPGEPLQLWVREEIAKPAKSPRKSSGAKSSKSAKKASDTAASVALSSEDEALEQRLRTWRLGEAKKLSVPAFCVLGNKTLRSIAMERPRTLADLLAISGIGNAKAEKFGGDICRICGPD